MAAYCWRHPRAVLISLAGTLLATLASLVIPLLQRDVKYTVIVTRRASVMTLVGVGVAPALWRIFRASRKRLFPASWHAQQQVGEVAGIVEEAIGGVRVIKGFGQEEQEMRRLEAASEELFASRLRTIRLTARYNPPLTAIPLLGMLGVLALGGWLAIPGHVTPAPFLAFSTYLPHLTAPVRVLTGF